MGTVIHRCAMKRVQWARCDTFIHITSFVKNEKYGLFYAYDFMKTEGKCRLFDMCEKVTQIPSDF